jgi:hypothetical protein
MVGPQPVPEPLGEAGQGARRLAVHGFPAARQQRAHEERAQAAEARGVGGPVFLQEGEERRRPLVAPSPFSARAHSSRASSRKASSRTSERSCSTSKARVLRSRSSPARAGSGAAWRRSGSRARAPPAPGNARRRTSSGRSPASLPRTARAGLGERALFPRQAPSPGGPRRPGPPARPPPPARGRPRGAPGARASCSSAARTRSAASGRGAGPHRAAPTRSLASPSRPLARPRLQGGPGATSPRFPSHRRKVVSSCPQRHRTGGDCA